MKLFVYFLQFLIFKTSLKGSSLYRTDCFSTFPLNTPNRICLGYRPNTGFLIKEPHLGDFDIVCLNSENADIEYIATVKTNRSSYVCKILSNAKVYHINRIYFSLSKCNWLAIICHKLHII